MSKAETTDSTINQGDALVRVLAAAWETDALWASRDIPGKAMQALGGAADRIADMANLCWALALADTMGGGHNKQHYRLFAHMLGDLGKALQAARGLWRCHLQREDEPGPDQTLLDRYSDLLEVLERLQVLAETRDSIEAEERTDAEWDALFAQRNAAIDAMLAEPPPTTSHGQNVLACAVLDVAIRADDGELIRYELSGQASRLAARLCEAIAGLNYQPNTF
jgi:hypothetical protein